ncbi:MAG TPA: DUF4845 domain-containing protein, partial [Steroidobacteraceae bacterium]|nr:DUF4845 domain-containing protein [Steroidobacteraceae bacterium]
ASETKSDNPDPATMKNIINRHWAIDDPTAVAANEIEITKDENGGLQLHLAYDDTAPYVANVSLAVHFDKTVKVQ